MAVTGAAKESGQGVYAWPSFLPDGRHFLYTVNAGFIGGQNSGIFVGSIDSKQGRRVVPVLSNARYALPGYLIYAKDGSRRAQVFDARRLEVQGEPSTLTDGVLYVPSSLSYLFSISDNGLLSYIGGEGGSRQFFWTDRSGKKLAALGEPGLLYSPRLSHDGKRVTYDRSDVTTDSGDIWVFDIERQVPNRLTYDPGNESAPVWSPDDRDILFFRNAGVKMVRSSSTWRSTAR